MLERLLNRKRKAEERRNLIEDIANALGNNINLLTEIRGDLSREGSVVPEVGNDQKRTTHAMEIPKSDNI